MLARSTYRPRRWQLAPADPASTYAIAWELDLSPVTAQVLSNRGLTTPGSARAFLTAGRDQLLDPLRLQDMDALVRHLREAIAAGRRIMVYGDYDVDGVTGTAVLVHTLRRLGAAADYYIPNRFDEGYGLNAAALQAIAARGHTVVLSVDTGTTAVAEAAVARELGLTLLVTDHHEPGPELPAVPALVNPKRPDCHYPFTGLSGVGVAFKLAQALCGPESPIPWESIDVVALGTIADNVPLLGENRCLVREGLTAIAGARRPGLRALLDVSNIRSDEVNPVSVAFGLAPRINALGRMSDASAGVELLLTDDPALAASLAGRLDAENRTRQQVEAAILEQALDQARSEFDPERDRILVLAGEGWHPGVVGIVASRVVDTFYRPAVLLSIDGDEAKGSARSIPGFHLYDALAEVSDLFTRFGGHAAAAGLTLPTAALPELRRRLGEVARRRLPQPPQPILTLDARVEAAPLSIAMAEELERVGPFGMDNPAPLLVCTGLRLLDARQIGKEGQHLKARLQGEGGVLLEAVGWGMGSLKPVPGQAVDVAFTPRIDTWNGRRSLQLQLADLRQAADPLHPAADLAPAALDGWDPLRHAADPAPAALPPLLSAATTAEAAAAAEAEHPLLRPAAVLARLAEMAPEQTWLVLCATPWAAAALRAALPAPRVIVKAWGEALPALPGAAVLLCAPPYAEGQVTAALQAAAPAAGLQALFRQDDWELARVALGWPYPDRADLVRLYRHLRSLNGATQPSEGSGAFLAAALAGLPGAVREPAGPWNRLRLQSALDVLSELGLATATPAGDYRLQPPPGGNGKLDLERSERYRRGQLARERLAACREWAQRYFTQENPSLS